jgi:hypothetical protein
VEFLRENLRTERLKWFAGELEKHGLKPGDRARMVEQRGESAFRFSALAEKVLWGDLADLLHMVYVFSPADDPIRNALAVHHFDGIYLGDRKMGFISEEFRLEMLEIWKVKFLEMARFQRGHFRDTGGDSAWSILNENGDSPDIPIPIYGYLNSDSADGTGKKIENGN